MKGRKKQRASSCSPFQEEGGARRERPSRGSTMGPGAGRGTHKTEKHVISPRRGEKARLREILRRLVLLPTPATIPPCQHPSVVGVPFLPFRFFCPFSCSVQSERATWCFLFVRISATAKYLVVTCRSFLPFFMYRLSRGKYENSCLTRINYCFLSHEKLGSLISEIIEK